MCTLKNHTHHLLTCCDFLKAIQREKEEESICHRLHHPLVNTGIAYCNLQNKKQRYYFFAMNILT